MSRFKKVIANMYAHNKLSHSFVIVVNTVFEDRYIVGDWLTDNSLTEKELEYEFVSHVVYLTCRRSKREDLGEW